MNKIVGIFRPVPKTKNSHNRAWAHQWGDLLDAECCHLSDDYQDADHLYLYVDINYTEEGGVNLFDGLSEDIFNRLNLLLKFAKTNKPITMIDAPIPNLVETCEGRFDNESTFSGFTKEFIKEIKEYLTDIPYITMSDYITNQVCIGDSHSVSTTDMKMPVIRLDAKTLGGAVFGSDGDFIKNLIPESVIKAQGTVRLMFGSIDVRHHIFRDENPYNYVDELIAEYAKVIKELQKLVVVQVHTILPVEYEERGMSATMQYKGTNFTGSLKDRQEMTEYFNNQLRKLPCVVYEYPASWYKMDPENYATKIMERPRGIHIGESHYRKNNYGIVKEMEEW